MAFVEGKQEVETFATEAAAQSLAYRVRLWGSHWRSQNPYAQIPKTLVDLLSEDTVPIVNDEAIGMITRQRFPELLQRPFRGCSVTLWWRIWRDPISMTTKT